MGKGEVDRSQGDSTQAEVDNIAAVAAEVDSLDKVVDKLVVEVAKSHNWVDLEQV